MRLLIRTYPDRGDVACCLEFEQGTKESEVTTYKLSMTFDVTYEAEGGISMIVFSDVSSVGGRPFREGAVVHVDANGAATAIEIWSLPLFDLDACAATYGFSDRAGAIGMALAIAAT
jgi:hypothetical protein